MKIVFYKQADGKKPVGEYIKTLSKEMEAKIIWEIGLLEKFGLELGEPYVKKIEGEKYNKLFELRIKFSSDISRIFYFCHTKDGCVMLHGYTKKSNKTDTNELDVALKYMNDYNKRGDNDGKKI